MAMPRYVSRYLAGAWLGAALFAATPPEDAVYPVGWPVDQMNGQFRVPDVVAEGVGMALALRSEYASAIKRAGGPEG